MKKTLLLCLLMVSMILSAQITLGEGSTTVGNAPVNTYYGYSYTQQIFTKQEINANAAGNITGLKFYLDPNADISNSSDWTIYLGHTTKTSFSSGSDWVPVSGLTEVFVGSITNSNGVVEMIFATPFPYNNTQNLVLAVDENTPSYDDDMFFHVYNGTTSNRAIAYRSDSNNPDPSSPPNGNALGYRSVVSLMGLTPSAIPNCPAVSYPADNATLIPVSPNITWNASAGATSYKVSIGTTPGGTNVANQQVVTTTSFTPSTPLSINTTYYLKVVAVGAGGESVGCSDTKFKTLPPPPSNDECASAVTLTVNPDLNCGSVTAGTTVSATDSGVDPAPCYGTPNDDVWYKFTATATTHIISLKNVVSAGTISDTDTYFQVLSGDCTNLTSILCSDPETASVPNLTPGSVYYVRVYSYSSGTESAQSFNICVGTPPPPPSNDECAGAVTLTVNPNMSCTTMTAGTTLSATDSGMAPSPCFGNPDDDVWYKFTATADAHVISLKDIVSVGTSSSTDTYFQVFSGTCGNLTNVLCSDPETSVVSGLTAGQMYYVRVYSYGGAGRAQSFKICVGTLPPPPTNDDCVSATTLTVNPNMNCTAVTSGHTLGATDSAVPLDSCSGTPDDDVWFKFTATSTKHIISLNNITSLGTTQTQDSYFQVFSGVCGSLVNVLCSDPDTGTVEGLTIGETYYVRVYTYGSGSDKAISFDICVGTIPPPPVNDDCTGALVVSSYPYTYTQADAAGATNNNGFMTVCSPGMNDGTWFKFTGDGTNHDISVTMPSGSYFDAEIGVYSGACGNLVCEGSADNGYTGGAESISIPTVAGTVYYVNVGHYSDDEDHLEGTFTITINKQTLGTSEATKAKDEIKVYPNPFAEVLNISKVDQVKSIAIMEVSGRLVKTIDTPSSVLHLGDLKQGMYLVVLNMKDGSKQTVKAIKK